MTVRKLIDGDIATSGNQFISGIDEIAQTVKTRLRLFLGEYFRDVREGTPWFQQILGKPESISAANAVIAQRISRTPGVQELIGFEVSFDVATRKYTIRAEILTPFGATQITLNEVVNADN